MAVSIWRAGGSAAAAPHAARPHQGTMQAAGAERSKRWGGHLRVSPAAVVMGAGMVLCTMWGLDAVGTEDVAACLLAALCHEAGHLVVAALAGVHIRAVTLDLFGARIHLDGLLSYRQELAVACGGPAANILTVACLMPLWIGRGGSFLGSFLFASLGLGEVNLLPVATLDGGRMLSCLLALTLGEKAARRGVAVTTGAVLLTLWLLSVYALLRAGNMLSLFIFTLCLMLRSMDTGRDRQSAC